jgi:hypothetical protein
MKSQEKWWKILPMSLFGFGMFAAILSLLPEYSPPYLILGGILAIIAALSSVIQRIEGYEGVKLITAQAGLLLFFLIGVRVLLFYSENSWIWVLPFLIAYVIAWLLPYLNSSLSQLIFREQVYPKTTPGRTIANLAWLSLPIVGGGGAFIGMYLSRSGQFKSASIFLGPLFMLVAIGWAQAASHQLREERNKRKEVAT